MRQGEEGAIPVYSVTVKTVDSETENSLVCYKHVSTSCCCTKARCVLVAALQEKATTQLFHPIKAQVNFFTPPLPLIAGNQTHRYCTNMFNIRSKVFNSQTTARLRLLEHGFAKKKAVIRLKKSMLVKLI